MTVLLRGRATFGGLLIALGLALSTQASGAVVWLAGVDPFVRSHMPDAGGGDFQTLFEPDAPWKRAASTVAVFKVSTQYLLHGSDGELRKMIADLNARGVALAFEALMIPRHGACGRVEGYSDPGAIAIAAERVKQLGGVLKYAAMDEPLWFGHFYGGQGACRSSVTEVAAALAENVRALRGVFPDIRIGDIEPFQGGVGTSLKPADVLAFAQAFRQATGTPLAFFDADLDWQKHADADLKALKAGLRAAGIRFGVIFDGDFDDPTDVAWTRKAEARVEQVEQHADQAPDDAVLQTWMIHPTRMLPESQPGTMTNLVLRYAREPTRLTLRRDREEIVGRLSTASATPVAGARIVLWGEEGGSATTITRRTLEGIVPHDATQALFAVRVNTESDGMAAGEIALGQAQYRESGAPAVERDPLGPNDSGQPMAVHAGQPISRGGSPFAVTGGKPFTLEVPMGVTAGLDTAGYVALIFLGVDGREMKRVTIPLTPGRRPLGDARTDARGDFWVTAPPSSKDLIIGAAYDGDERVRGCTATAN